MSRIDSSECFCMDMEWYGVDKKGNIAVFCSAGEGYLPEFVCEDVERAEELMEAVTSFSLIHSDTTEYHLYLVLKGDICQPGGN